jgi:uncharacterized protein (TIGR00369 family)
MTQPVDDLGPTAPFLAHCGIRRLERKDGTSRNEIVVTPALTNGAAAAHGGLIMTLLDSAMTGAARSLLTDDHAIMTIDMQVAFLAPGKGHLTGFGRVLRNGSSLVYCEGEVRDEAGQLVARATGMFRPRRPNREPAATIPA